MAGKRCGVGAGMVRCVSGGVHGSSRTIAEILRTLLAKQGRRKRFDSHGPPSRPECYNSTLLGCRDRNRGKVG